MPTISILYELYTLYFALNEQSVILLFPISTTIVFKYTLKIHSYAKKSLSLQMKFQTSWNKGKD